MQGAAREERCLNQHPLEQRWENFESWSWEKDRPLSLLIGITQRKVVFYIFLKGGASSSFAPDLP